MRRPFKDISLIISLIISFHIAISAQTNEQMEKSNNTDLFIYQLKLTPEFENQENWTEETYKLIQEHREFLNNLGKKGILIFAGRTKFDPGNENLFGIAVIKASSIERANKIMAKDPAVINRIQEASIFPFSMVIQYFENLKITKHG